MRCAEPTAGESWTPVTTVWVGVCARGQSGAVLAPSGTQELSGLLTRTIHLTDQRKSRWAEYWVFKAAEAIGREAWPSGGREFPGEGWDSRLDRQDDRVRKGPVCQARVCDSSWRDPEPSGF